MTEGGDRFGNSLAGDVRDRRIRLRLAQASLAVALLALLLKYLAWRETGSVALKSDALETLINVAAAVAGLWAIHYASRPADHNHTYGHHKAEYLSAILESALVLFTSLTIAAEAWEGWMHPRPLESPWTGLVFNGVATLLNLVWGAVLLRAGRAQRSPALIAGGQHVLSDVWTGVGLVVGVGLIPLTGWLWLDPVLAALIALNVVRVGWGMLRESVSGLMDEAPGSETMTRLEHVIRESGAGALEAHDIRVRIVGSVTFVEFHLVVAADMSVSRAHEICDRIEAAIRRALGQALISIHVEPQSKLLRRGVLISPEV
ncbi:cation diffusion facilitator family transporter [Acetobacter sp. AN02]|uniref:cation diffusion facilitator family transporter n=1 Tax=Acetobacter sp. AN02 TaxID=2894186 RepID=UPI0024341631|nr:cation diffusion facilitator family transporter [Acetobacter sp. AN02]MDG6095314.1 cation diffusion facilitator family transporter [Acetobacter sp. AN02]